MSFNTSNNIFRCKTTTKNALHDLCMQRKYRIFKKTLSNCTLKIKIKYNIYKYQLGEPIPYITWYKRNCIVYELQLLDYIILYVRSVDTLDNKNLVKKINYY